MNSNIDKSAYNEASYKMARINECQTKINHVNGNLLKFYDEYGMFGYNVKKTELKNLLLECYGKLYKDKTHENKINLYIKIMDDFLIYLPFRTVKTIMTVSGPKKIESINQENLNNYKRILDEVHVYCEEAIEVAGYSTFSQDTYDPDDPYA